MRLALATTVLALVCAAMPARAALLVGHEGFLLDGDDHPVDAPELQLTFQIFDQKASVTSEHKLWEAACPVAVRGGHYAVLLGETGCGGPLGADVFSFTGERWLAITVGTSPLTPRMRLASVPTAVHAADADKLAGAGPDTFWKKAEAVEAATLGTHAAADFWRKAEEVDALTLGGKPLGDFWRKAEAVDAATLGGKPLGDFWRKAEAVDAATLGGKSLGDLDARYVRPTGGDVALPGGVTARAFIGDGSGLTNLPGVGVGAGLTGDGRATPLSISTNGVGATLLASDAAALAQVTGGAAMASSGRIGIGTTTPLAALDVAGGIRLGNDAGACTAARGGTLRWTGTALEACVGTAWVAVALAGLGTVGNAGASCKAIKLASGGVLADGTYWLDPDGAAGPIAPFQATCDMTSNGGGWTLVYRNADFNYDHDNDDNLPVTPAKTRAKLASATINRLSGQAGGSAYELRLQGPVTTTLMKATEPFYVGQISGRSVTIQYDCDKDGVYEKSFTWHEWTTDRGAAESASWIRDWVYPSNGICNAWNGGNVMQFWAGSLTPTPATTNRPISATATSYTHSGDVMVWVR